MHELQNPKIQKAYLRQYMTLVNELDIKSGSRVLDIGSGLGFLKPLVNDLGATYIGIEPDRTSFESACVLYGQQGYLNGFFPEVIADGVFDVIIALSCVDEVIDKSSFLSSFRSRLEPANGIGYIAVRNSAFFINRFKTKKIMSKRSERSRISSNDLTASEWEALIAASGMQICERGKFWRPWLTGISFIGLKNIAYRLISILMPRTRAYMLYYKIKATK